MPKLNDTQTILLSTASRRDDLALHPLEGVAAGARVTKAIAALIKAGLAEDRGDGAIFATLAGLTAIGVETGASEAEVASAPTEAEPRVSKTATVITLLKRETGATMPDLIAATGWLPHTTRAALTGLRKKGHAIERVKCHDQTCYRIAEARP